MNRDITKEIQDLMKQRNELNIEVFLLKKRIDKAIEYIEEFDIEYNKGLTYGETKHLLEILKGVNDD